jgi:hypothetical protein
MAKVTAAQKAAAEAAALEAKAQMEEDQAEQAAAIEVVEKEEAPGVGIDTFIAGEEIEDATDTETPEVEEAIVNIPEEEEEVSAGDEVEEEGIQPGMEDSQDEDMPEDHEAEFEGKYDFSAKRLEEYLLSDKGQDKILQEFRGGNYISTTDHTIYVPLSLFIK